MENTYFMNPSEFLLSERKGTNGERASSHTHETNFV